MLEPQLQRMDDIGELAPRAASGSRVVGNDSGVTELVEGVGEQPSRRVERLEHALEERGERLIGLQPRQQLVPCDRLACETPVKSRHDVEEAPGGGLPRRVVGSPDIERDVVRERRFCEDETERRVGRRSQSDRRSVVSTAATSL